MYMAIRKRQLVPRSFGSGFGSSSILKLAVWRKQSDCGCRYQCFRQRTGGRTAGKRFCGFFTVIGSIGGCVKCRFRKRCIRGFFRSGQYRSEYRCKYIILHRPDWNVRNPETLLRNWCKKVLDDTTADENTKTEAANQAAEISKILLLRPILKIW